MKKILRQYFSAVLAIFAILFLVLIIGYFTWGVGYIVTEVNSATNSHITSPSAGSFDLAGAAALDYKGLMPQAAATSS